MAYVGGEAAGGCNCGGVEAGVVRCWPRAGLFLSRFWLFRVLPGVVDLKEGAAGGGGGFSISFMAVVVYP